MKRLLIITIQILLFISPNFAQTAFFEVPEIPAHSSFAGEQFPLHNWDVRERLDRELMINVYMQSKTMHIIKLSGRYKSQIKEILRANGIPEDFYYLCVAESALLNQTSSAGAVGFWQFMSATGRSLGLEINGNVDERYDWQKSTLAACKYLNQAYSKFGSWVTAAASYNCGMGGVSSRLSAQNTTSYFDLKLPEETERYIFRIMALKIILENPIKYGYKVSPSEMYRPIPSESEEITSSISNLVEWATLRGTTYRMIKEMNPWLRGTSLPVLGGKSYTILIPKK